MPNDRREKPRKRATSGRRPSKAERGPARRPPGPSREPPRRGPFGFGIANYATLALGVVAIVLGYVQLDNGSVTAAPILLILGYAVLLPLGIVLGWRRLDEGR